MKVGTATELPASDLNFKLDYEGYHALGPWCTVDTYKREGVTIILATDESDTHEGTSLTNRVERVMYLAWERMGNPWPCHFVEHYRRSVVHHSRQDASASFRNGHDFDEVTFALVNGKPDVVHGSWFKGQQLVSFRAPQWMRLNPENAPMLLRRLLN